MTFEPLTREELIKLTDYVRQPRSATEVAIALDMSYERARAVLEYWREGGRVHHPVRNGGVAHWLYVL